MSSALMLAAFGQHDAERARGDFGILEEQLVEIAHPVEQQQPGIGGLDLQILFHHRRDARAPRLARLGGRVGREWVLDRHGGANYKILPPDPIGLPRRLRVFHALRRPVDA